MSLDNLIAAVIVIAILGGAITYIVRAKKKGIRCIGCPDASRCSGNCSGCSGNCGCSGSDNKK